MQTKMDSTTQELSVDDYLAQGRRMMRLYDAAGYEQAVVAFRHALELDPGSVEANAFLAETYSYWGFREELNGRESQSYYDLSLNLAEQSVRLGMHQPESHRALSVALRRGKHADAELSRSEILIAVDLRSDDAETWYQYWRAFGYDVSDPSIHRALELDPALCGAHNDLAAALVGKDRYPEALVHLQAALKINPRNSLVQYNLAMVLDHMGMGDKAIAFLRRARQLHPGDPLLETGWVSLGGGMS
ncbi:MAG: tetratricopeptide repeat protein [Elusimicrobiota bacterium]